MIVNQYAQQVKLANGLQKLTSRSTTLAKYVDRDPRTGYRIVESISGSRAQVSYISNSKPKEYISGVTFGTALNPGYIDQKPA